MGWERSKKLVYFLYVDNNDQLMERSGPKMNWQGPAMIANMDGGGGDWKQ